MDGVGIVFEFYIAPPLREHYFFRQRHCSKIYKINYYNSTVGGDNMIT